MGRYFTYMILLALLGPFTALAQEENQESTINIGLLLRDTSNWWSQASLLDAFVDKANKLGGYQNRDFKLVVRTTEGPWGTGSKESVSLVYEDNVCAILGLQHGRDAHLTEQVAAKSHVSYIECLATEPTLSQAFVPYFFRMVPNDDQQAEAILELIEKRGGGQICILSTENYDARYAVNSLVKASARKTGQAPLVIDMDSKDMVEEKVIEKIRRSKIKHLIFPFDADRNKELHNALKKELPNLLTYGTLHFTLGLEIEKEHWKNYEGMYLVSLGPIWLGENYLWNLSSVASSTDALNLVIQAIREVGTDREAIKNYLADIKTYGEHSGPISFDKLGNRTPKPVFSKIEKGKRVIHHHK